MALTRRMLQAMGIESEKIDEIIEAHVEVVDSIKAERDAFKADAEALPGVKSELEALKASANNNKENSYKVKYEAIKEEFEEYKKGIDEKASKEKKESAYRALLKNAGIPDKRIDAVMKVSDYGSIEFDEDGNTKNAEELTKAIKEEWADFIPTTHVNGANMANPPANNGKATKTKEEIRAIEDPVARQKAMIENASLFPSLSGIAKAE